MQFWRCRCGKQQVSESGMCPKPCQGCEDCNTTLAQHPDDHRTPAPHNWETRYHPRTGKSYERCAACGELKDGAAYVRAGMVETS